MSDSNTSGLWTNSRFVRLFWSHVISLVGSGVSSLAIGLLAKELAGANVTTVVGFSLTIRIAVLVLVAPWSGKIADMIGRKAVLILADLLRVVVVLGFFWVDAVWQIYVLSVFLHLGSALFTPTYKAVIPGITGEKHYPKALAYGTMAYDLSTIAGPSLAALFIAWFGYRGNFVVNAGTFLVSALMSLFIRLEEPGKRKEKPETSVLYGMRRMVTEKPLLISLIYALWVSIAGALALVSTVGYVTVEMKMTGTAYAWAMAALGLGSTAGVLGYAHMSEAWQRRVEKWLVPVLVVSLLSVAFFKSYVVLIVAWIFSGAVQSVLMNMSNRQLSENTKEDERPHVYAAHFSLSHAGWGLTYPATGLLTTKLGFNMTAGIFAGLLVLSVLWAARVRAECSNQ